MNAGLQLANRFREVILNGTWVANTNYKAQLEGTSWELAVHRTGVFNTIATLTSHIHYYIAGMLQVLEGGTLDIKDKFSFDFPPVTSQEDWENILNTLWRDSEKFASLVEQMPEEKLREDFTDKKYGSYERNIDAMIEHSYYHLGQIVLLKKMQATT
ncbi:MAG: DinB family protein [Ferruginibacter sp.]